MNLSKANLKRIADLKIAQFKSQIKRSVCRSDAEKYLLLWSVVAAKDYDWHKLGEKERNEILDILMDEED